MNIENALARVELFSGMSADMLTQVAQIVGTRTAKKGEMLFLEGQEADGFYCIVTGSVRIFKAALSGKEHTVHLFGPGATFAEVVAFAGTRFPANAEVLEDSALIFVPRTGLRGLFAQDPDLALAMMGLLSRRLMEFLHKIEQLSLKEVPARLAAHYLLLAGDAEEFTLQVPKGRLANYLGTQPETLSRSQAKLVDAGLIAVDGAHVRILDRGGLSDVAKGAAGCS